MITRFNCDIINIEYRDWNTDYAITDLLVKHLNMQNAYETFKHVNARCNKYLNNHYIAIT